MQVILKVIEELIYFDGYYLPITVITNRPESISLATISNILPDLLIKPRNLVAVGIKPGISLAAEMISDSSILSCR